MTIQPFNLDRIACIVLAAGGSKRLGRPKQLLQWKGKPLLVHGVATALDAELTALYVVTGAYAKSVQEIMLPFQQVQLVEHPQWENGMGSSISKAVSHVQKNGTFNAVLLLLCDQPMLNAEILNQMVKLHQQYPTDIIQCRYETGQGPPVLFPSNFFDELIMLDGQDGARHIIRAHPSKLKYVDFKHGNIDIDTPEDLIHLLEDK